MSVVEDNPWLIVVMEDNEEELPAAIPKNWLVDNNTNVVWPPSYMVSKATKLKSNPEKNWTRYKLKSVYWDTRKLICFFNNKKKLRLSVHTDNKKNCYEHFDYLNFIISYVRISES